MQNGKFSHNQYYTIYLLGNSVINLFLGTAVLYLFAYYLEASTMPSLLPMTLFPMSIEQERIIILFPYVCIILGCISILYAPVYLYFSLAL